MYNKTEPQSNIKKMLIIRMTVILAVLFGFTCLVLSPLHSIFSTYSIYKYTILPDITNFLIQLLNLFSFGISFAIIIFSIYKLKYSGSVMIIATYVIATFIKYAVNMAVYLVLFKAMSQADVFYVFVSFLIDTIIVMIVSIIAHTHLKKELPDFPAKSISISIGLLMAATKVISRLVFDVTTYGLLPKDIIDFLWMVLYYSLDILSGALVSFIIIKTIRILKNKTV